MNGILRVLYSCKGCGVVDRGVIVRHRAEGQDIVKWVQYVAERVGIDHSLESPRCQQRTADIKIPVNEDATAIGVVGSHT